jgi:hypothetical protein
VVALPVVLAAQVAAPAALALVAPGDSNLHRRASRHSGNPPFPRKLLLATRCAFERAVIVRNKPEALLRSGR